MGPRAACARQRRARGARARARGARGARARPDPGAAPAARRGRRGGRGGAGRRAGRRRRRGGAARGARAARGCAKRPPVPPPGPPPPARPPARPPASAQCCNGSKGGLVKGSTGRGSNKSFDRCILKWTNTKCRCGAARCPTTTWSCAARCPSRSCAPSSQRPAPSPSLPCPYKPDAHLSLPPLPVQTGRTSLPPTHTSPRPGRVPYERASALGVCAGPRATALRPHAEPDRLHLHAPLPPLLFSLPCPLL